MTEKKDITEFFGDDFEVTYDGDVTDVQTDLNNDAYKDALSALSELDDTHSLNYLEINKTKTIKLNEYLKEQQEIQRRMKREAHEEGPLKKLFHSIISGKK